jgi:putative oxidoreductase
MNNSFIGRIRDFVLAVAAKLDWLPGLVARLTLGGIFVQTGWGKLHNLPKVIEFFGSLGIPAPQIQAPFASAMEFLCGVLVLIGLFTRVAAVPLIVIMAVAIKTAKMGDVKDISDFLSLSEYLFAVLALWLAVKGPGALSLDWFINKRCAGVSED